MGPPHKKNKEGWLSANLIYLYGWVGQDRIYAHSTPVEMLNELKGKIFISSKTMDPMEFWMLLFLFTGLYPGLCTVKKNTYIFFYTIGVILHLSSFNDELWTGLSVYYWALVVFFPTWKIESKDVLSIFTFSMQKWIPQSVNDTTSFFPRKYWKLE